MCPPDEEHVDTDGENPNNTAEICAGLLLGRQPCWPSGVLGESLELGRRCSHYMAPLWVCQHIDLNKHFKKEQMLGPSSPMGKIAASGSEIKGSRPAVSLVTQGSSPLGDPG